MHDSNSKNKELEQHNALTSTQVKSSISYAGNFAFHGGFTVGYRAKAVAGTRNEFPGHIKKYSLGLNYYRTIQDDLSVEY